MWLEILSFHSFVFQLVWIPDKDRKRWLRPAHHHHQIAAGLILRVLHQTRLLRWIIRGLTFLEYFNIIFQDDLKSSLIIDNENYQIVCPLPQGNGYCLSNCIPSVIGHTKVGYAFEFKNAENRSRDIAKLSSNSNLNYNFNLSLTPTWTITQLPASTIISTKTSNLTWAWPSSDPAC